jgi:osmoprotectant transport system ATP-binding protein
VIELQGLTKRYGEKVAVDGVTLDVPEGEVAVLIGPSGSGKTTTMRMINRMIEPTSGRILVDGRDVMSQSPTELRRSLGYAIQSVGLFPHLTVAENIGTVPRLLKWDKKRIASRTDELLRLVGLDPAAYAAKYPRQLSGGEAQRVGVARALAADPPVLLMDEPFGAVDPLTRDRLQGEFARIQRTLKKTVVFVTHDVDEAIRLADRIAILRDGRLQQYATPEEILDHPVNKFVHDFMGADRALKRLGRACVSDVMDTDVARIGEGLEPSEILTRAARWNARFVYVTDERDRLTGWLDREDLDSGASAAEAFTPVDWQVSSIQADTTLKEALSVMLGLGFRQVAVVDPEGRLLGEVGLAAIEATMVGSDSQVTHVATSAPAEGGADPEATGTPAEGAARP